MGSFDFHTALSERHRRIMDSFARREKYGSRRRVLERALDLLQPLDGVDVTELLESLKVRRDLMELFNFVLVNSELVESLANAVLRKTNAKTLLEDIRELILTDFKRVQKFLGRKAVNSYQDMVESIVFYSRYLNIIGKVCVNEGQRQVFIKLNVFKSLPEIAMEVLNSLLESSGYTFDLKLEERNNPLFIITWIPPDHPEVKQQKERYLSVIPSALA